MPLHKKMTQNKFGWPCPFFDCFMGKGINEGTSWLIRFSHHQRNQAYHKKEYDLEISELQRSKS